MKPKLPKLFASIPTTATANHRLQGIGFMLLSTFLWAALELVGGVIPDNYKALLVVWVRYGSHLAFMLIVFAPRYRIDLVRTRAPKLQLFRPVFMIGMPLFFLVGVRFMPVSNVWSAFWIAPFMTMTFAAFLFKEKVRIWQWLTTLIGLFGAIAIYQPKAGFFNWTLIFPLGMAFCFSGYLVLTRALRKERTVTNLFYTALIVFLPWSLGFFYYWRPLNLIAFSAMTAIGILGFWSLYFLDKAVERAPVSVVTPFLFGEPVFILLLGYFLFGSSPSTVAILGGVFLFMVIGSLILHELLDEKAPQTQKK
jgi:drug/metabolite transporter (DMT)-like permease